MCIFFGGRRTAKQVALHSHAGLIKMLHGKCFCAMQVPVLAFHHSPEIYRNPEAYVPERWMDGTPEYAQDSQVQGKWMPFGDGTRVCVGQRLALMEAKVALAHVFRRCGLSGSCAPLFESNTCVNVCTCFELSRLISWHTVPAWRLSSKFYRSISLLFKQFAMSL